MTERKELPKVFQLTDEQKAEIGKLAQALHEKCIEFEAPAIVAICAGNDGEGWTAIKSAYFNGERTPGSMSLAHRIIDKNIGSPLQLIASITG